MLTIAAFLTALCLVAFTSSHKLDTRGIVETKKKTIYRCSPDRREIMALLENSDIMPMPGTGSYQWNINTSNDSAQFYFNQGINMYYGFHIIEALASFKKASRFDPKNSMVWWAQALALGPNINDIGYASSPEALDVTQKAVDLSSSSSPVQKMLIHAMSVRYSKDSTQSRELLNQRYVDEMKKAYENFPGNADVAALYADALMLQHPWDLWNNNGTPKAWTPRIRAVLEKLIANTHLHPGANHYYIHVMEASPYAALALPSADRLGKLTPGLSHMVHMPSHIYLRTGQFNKGTDVNEDAVKQFEKYTGLFPSVAEGIFLYQWHNLHLQANCAWLAGKGEYAEKTAMQLRAAIDTNALSLEAPLGSSAQYLYMTSVFVDIRFAKWDHLLAMNNPGENHSYAAILYHFGKGMAYAALKNFNAAENEKQSILQLMKDPQLAIPIKPFSPALDGARCAQLMLSGFIRQNQNDLAASISDFEKAVETEANMVYDEPRDWLLSPKQYLGAVYLKASKYLEAQKVFEKDLKVNDNNIWSLYGLEKALLKQKKQQEASAVKTRLSKASVKSDVNPENIL